MKTRPIWAALVVALAASFGLMVTGEPAALAGSPALSDPAAHGGIGLCAGSQQVTGGSIYTHPFVWKAVATTPPPTQFRGRGENTALLIYAPRPDVPPAEWTGDQLTAASYYKHGVPTAVATAKDESLADVMKVYPSGESGLYQLRMQMGKTDYAIYSASYPAATIRVTGDRWSVVDGATVNCARATAVSNEVLTGVVRPALASPPKGGTSSFTVAGVSSQRSASGSAGSQGHAPGGSLAADSASHPSHSSSATAAVVVALAALIALVLAVGIVRRHSAASLNTERTR